VSYFGAFAHGDRDGDAYNFDNVNAGSQRRMSLAPDRSRHVASRSART
jgi:hypothetical protein